MKVLRSLTAGLCILLGVLLIIVWALSYGVTKLVTDGDVVSSVATGALDNEEVTGLVVDQVDGHISAELEGQGINLDAIGLGGTLTGLITALVESDQFSTTIADAVGEAHSSFEEQLTDPDREPAPLVLSLDVGASITRTLSDTPLIGDAIGAAEVEPVEVPVMEAEPFERVRGVYKWIDRAARWAGWLGLTLLVVGLLVSPRKQWFLPKLFFGLGIASGFGYLSMWWLSADRLARLAPGGEDGAAADMARAVVSDDFLDRMQGRLLVAMLVCLAVALALFIVVKLLKLDRKRRAGAHEDTKGLPHHAR